MREKPVDSKYVFSKLEGSWAVSREVPSEGHFEGHANFERVNIAELAFSETGVLTQNNGQHLDAFRRYVYRFENGEIAVYFDEEPRRLFHKLVLRSESSSISATGLHHCGDDIYSMEYNFAVSDCFTITHRVKGPRKNYRMISVFRRLPRKPIFST